MQQEGRNRPGGKSGKENPFFIKIGKYAAIGLEFPGTIIGGLFFGYLVDLYFNTFPWAMAVFTLLGLVGACIRLAQILQRFSGDDQ